MSASTLPQAPTATDPARRHRVVNPKVLYFGTPVVLVSTVNPDGSANLAPMSSAWWLDRSAMLGLAATSRTSENLLRDGDCVLNLPGPDLVGAVDRLALLTGRPDVPPHKVARGYTYETDKFAAAGLTAVRGDLVRAARVAECGVQLEARLRAAHPFGGDDGAHGFEVEVVRVHVAEDLLVPGSERYIDPVAWDPLIMKFCEYFGGGSNVAASSLARGWRMQHAGTGVLDARPAGG